MNLFLGQTHLETLCDLKAIAEKHNAKLNFGFESSANTDFETGLLEKEKVNKKVIKFLEENSYSLKNVVHNCDKVWFEVSEKTTDGNNKYHVMSYLEESLSFNLDERDISYELNETSPKTQELITDFIASTEYDGFFSYSDSPTVITGFGNTKKITDYRVYRSGMALKFFADLVCDYFNEPRIERVY